MSPSCLENAWPSSGNPVRSYTLLNYESPEFVRFVNPGDLRIAHLSLRHDRLPSARDARRQESMMTHGCMLWGAALYNNGAVTSKWSQYGESYSMNGTPQAPADGPAPHGRRDREERHSAILDPLPRFQITQPGNILRIFERGGRFSIETGIPERLEEPGRPTCAD